MKTTALLSIAAAAMLAASTAAAQPALARSDAAAREADKKPAPTGPFLNEDYRLGAGDKLRIEVYKDPQLSQSLEVRPDGKITMPLLGDLEASGLTPLQLRDQIAKALKDYINNPVVTVIVVEANAAHAYVMGEVSKPGPVQLHGPTTVIQALALAGGFKEFANTKNVKILRQGPNGAMQTIEFNYRDAINGEGRPVYLRAGDTVVVP